MALSGNLQGALDRARSEGRFEGSGSDEARALAQLDFEQQQKQKQAERSSRALDERVGQFGREQKELLAQQRAEQQGAVKAFQDLIAGFEKPEDRFARLEAERGVPEMREQASQVRQRLADTEALLSQLPEDIISRTQGTLTTEAQRRRIQAKESEPLFNAIQSGARQLEMISGDMRDALAGVSQMVQFALIGEDRLLEGQKLQIATNADIQARELTGFNTRSQAELDNLLRKTQRAESLADQDRQRLFELAQQEAEFANAKENTILADMLAGQRQEDQNEFALEMAQLGHSEAIKLAEKKHGFDVELAQLRSRLGGSGGGGSTANMRDFEFLSSIFGRDQAARMLFGASPGGGAGLISFQGGDRSPFSISEDRSQGITTRQLAQDFGTGGLEPVQRDPLFEALFPGG